MFLHNVKAGGSTIWRTLEHKANETGGYLCTCHGRHTDCVEDIRARERGGKRCSVFFGANVQTLREFLRPRQCLWATIVRDPVASCVSSLEFCRHEGRDAKDQLCGNQSKVDALTSSLREWAVHRSSPLLWQLALDPAIHERLAGRPLASLPKYADIWEFQKSAYRGALGDQVATVTRDIAERVARGTMFDIVGVMERWEESMRLFDTLLPLSGNRTWTDEGTRRRADHGSESYKATEHEELRQAKNDTVLLQTLATDRIIHAAFLQAFEALRAPTAGNAAKAARAAKALKAISLRRLARAKGVVA